MRKIILLSVAFGLVVACASAWTVAAPSEAKEEGIQTPSLPVVTTFIAANPKEYSRAADAHWVTDYKGKKGDNIPVHILPVENLVLFIVNVAEKADLTMDEECLLYLMEANGNFDYAKVALSDKNVQIRVSRVAHGLTLEEFRFLEQQAAATADELNAGLAAHRIKK